MVQGRAWQLPASVCLLHYNATVLRDLPEGEMMMSRWEIASVF